MRKIVVLSIALALGGCATSRLTLDTTVSRNALLGVESAYGIALSGERTYKKLCQTHAVTGSCRTIVAQLQAADRTAIQSIHAAVAFVKTYPNVDASNVIGAANTAVYQLQSILTSNGVQ